MSDEMPDVNSPEFRSVMLDNFMSKQKDANATVALVNFVNELTFNELTPELWARVAAAMEAVEGTAKFVLASIDAMDFFIDDPESMEKVKNAVLASCVKCGCDQGKHMPNGCLGIQRLSHVDGYGESCRCDGFEGR